jgi:Family of unknown function (DUF6325)
MASEIGPVDYMIVAFPGNQFKGEIAPALADLVEAGTIRIIDLAFVGKDADGEAVAFELTELDPNEEDLISTAEELEPNTSAALLVWENVWARDVKQAIINAGGQLVAFERIPHEIVAAAREFALEAAGKES